MWIGAVTDSLYMNKIIKKFLAVSVLLAFTFANTTADVGQSYYAPSCLAPVSNFKPIVDIVAKDGLLSIEESPRGDEPAGDGTGLRAGRESFRDDVAFIYLNQLVARAIQLKLGPEGLKSLVREHFSRTGKDLSDFFGRFKIEDAYERDGIFCVPYETKSSDRIQILKYYDADGKTDALPGEALIRLDGITVVLDDPEPDNYYTAYTHISTNISEYGKMGLIDPSKPSEGITRLGFSSKETEVHFRLIREMSRLGFDVSIDRYGNTYIRYDGGVSDPDAKTVRIMSHMDTVKAGGRYDGAAGIMAGVEILRMLKQEARKLTSPVELVVYRCEESTRFGTPLMGSGLAVGKIKYEKRSPEERAAIDAERERVKDLARKVLGVELRVREGVDDISRISEAFEIHAEQGNNLFLDARKREIALAVGIAAAVRYKVEVPAGAVAEGETPEAEDIVYLRFIGQQDHSGATPMLTGMQQSQSARRDALCALAQFTEVLSEKLGRDDLVYGLSVKNGSINTIPGEVIAAVKISPEEMGAFNEAKECVLGLREGIKIEKAHFEAAENELGIRPGKTGCPQAYKGVLDIVRLLEREAHKTCARVFSALENGDTAYSPYSFPVGTIGEVTYDAGKNNIVFKVDIRGFDVRVRQELVDTFIPKAEAVIRGYPGIDPRIAEWEWPSDYLSRGEPTPTDEELRRRVGKVASDHGIPYMEFHSGAGHDLMNFARPGTQIGLIFVPSIEGISHNPAEMTETGSIVKACLLLYDYISERFGDSPRSIGGTDTVSGRAPPAAAKEEEMVAQAERKAEEFVDEIKLRAREASQNGQKLIIGIDSEWAEKAFGSQRSILQGLIGDLEVDLPRYLARLGLDVVIKRGRGADLAEEIKKTAQKEGTAYENVIVFGEAEHVVSGMFNDLTGEDPDNSAFLVGVDVSLLAKEPRPDEANYLRVLEMMTVALKTFKDPNKTMLYQSDSLDIKSIGPKKFLFMPKAEPVDLKVLKHIYEAQRQAMVAA